MNLFPTPALILELGTALTPALCDVNRMFTQSDPRRAAVTRFLALRLGNRKGRSALLPIQEARAKKDRVARTWKQVYDQTQKHANVLKSELEAALHELRGHEKLIEVGLGDQAALPMNVFIVSDLSEADSAAMIPLLTILQSLLAGEPFAKIHLLLGTAVFGETHMAETRVFFALGRLKEMLDGWDAQKNGAVLPSVYLFDKFKEGIWEAHDAAELSLILGNVLLAFLSGGLAQRLAYANSPLDMRENNAWFRSAAATVLFFDLDEARRACIARLALEIVTSEFHSTIAPDPGPQEEMAGYFIENHANLQTWLGEFCQETMFHAGGLGLDFHIPDLHFEDLPMEDWGRTIEAYDQNFQASRLPTQGEILNRNTKAVNETFREKLATFADLLPQLPRLYPGGVRSARQVLERVRRELSEGSVFSGGLQTTRKDWDECIRDGLGRLESGLRQLPKPPRWFFRLPSTLKKIAVQVFQALFLRTELQTILEIRQECVRLLEQKYTDWMRRGIYQKLSELGKGWVEALDEELKALARLQSMLDGFHRRITQQAGSLNVSPSLFRLSGLDETALNWIMFYGKRPQEGFRNALLGDGAFLKGWQKIKPKALAMRLEEFCRGVYQPLSNIDLEDILLHRGDQDAERLATMLMQGAIPLLRPNYDRTGGGSSFQSRFFLCKEPRSSSLFPALKNESQEWQEIDSGDRYLTICCRVRSLIPLSALDELFKRGRAAYEFLGRNAQAEFSAEGSKK